MRFKKPPLLSPSHLKLAICHLPSSRHLWTEQLTTPISRSRHISTQIDRCLSAPNAVKGPFSVAGTAICLAAAPPRYCHGRCKQGLSSSSSSRLYHGHGQATQAGGSPTTPSSQATCTPPRWTHCCSRSTTWWLCTVLRRRARNTLAVASLSLPPFPCARRWWWWIFEGLVHFSSQARYCQCHTNPRRNQT